MGSRTGIASFLLLALLPTTGCSAPGNETTTAAADEPESASVVQAVSPSVNPFNEPYTIGAWYFTAWSQVNDAQAFWSKDTLGVWDPWGGVFDSYLHPELVPFNADHSFVPRTPKISYYDLIDQRVMDKHIVQAASRGLSYFAFYWYWDADYQAESQISTPIHRFVSSPSKALLKFMLAPMRVSTVNPPPATSLASFEQRLVPYIVDTFFVDPSYLVTTDGRPIIADWDFGLAPADHAMGMRFLREYTFAKLGKYPLILGLTEVGLSPDDDGMMCFQMNMVPPGVLHGTQQSIDYAQMMQSWPGTFASGVPQGTTNVPCTVAGFDARPWCLIQPWACGQGQVYWYYNTGVRPEPFQGHLGRVKTFLDSNPASSMKALTIYAWNEWGEGGVIEPSQIWGTQYLDAIRTVFGLQPRTTDTANVNLGGSFGSPPNKLAVFVERSYQLLLGRIPTAAEVASYANIVLDKLQFIEAITNSPEYASKWSAQLTTPSGVVNLYFQQFLSRAPSSADLATYTPMVTGYGRSMLLRSILFAPEHFAKDPILSPTSSTATLTQGLAQVYRMRGGSDYFFTSDVLEMGSARQAGYMVEGPAWKVFTTGGTGRAPLVRCRAGSFHFLSAATNCEGQTVEGVMGYGTGPVAGSADLIRFASPTGAHTALLSTDTSEINAMPSYGFQREGTLVSLPSW